MDRKKVEGDIYRQSFNPLKSDLAGLGAIA
jgi:hypothetical protein